jgi:hypothetical protein
MEYLIYTRIKGKACKRISDKVTFIYLLSTLINGGPITCQILRIGVITNK